MIAGLASFLTDTLVWTGALIAAVLVLRRPVARLFGPGVAYALWLLPLLRLVLPPLPLPAAFAPATPAAVPAAAGAKLVTVTMSAPAAQSLVLPWELLLTSAWLGGAVLFLVARWLEYRAMRAHLLAGAVVVDRREGVRIVEAPAVDAPVAFGIRDKVIALPPRFLISGSLAERELAIAHELAHHRGHDLIANIVAQPCLALHWFNPLAWAAWNAMRRDQEAACDARTMAGRDARTRAAYARVIAGFAAGERLTAKAALAAPMACPVLGDKSIVHRLRSLTMSEISSRRRCAGRWTLAAGAALALPLTATVVYAGQDTPVPPTPAVAPIAPIAPQAPVAPKSVKHVVIVHDDANHADGHGAAAFERRVERDGKTIVVRSERELSEADFEAKLAELETRLATLDPIGGPDGIAFADGEGKRKFVFRRQFAPGKQGEGEHELLMRHFGPGEAPAMHAMMLDASQCAKGEEASAEAEADADGQRQVVRIKLCGASAHRGEALKAIREARSEIAGDKELSEAIRAKVLEQLDRSIERMEKEAR